MVLTAYREGTSTRFAVRDRAFGRNLLTYAYIGATVERCVRACVLYAKKAEVDLVTSQAYRSKTIVNVRCRGRSSVAAEDEDDDDENGAKCL